MSENVKNYKNFKTIANYIQGLLEIVMLTWKEPLQRFLKLIGI